MAHLQQTNYAIAGFVREVTACRPIGEFEKSSVNGLPSASVPISWFLGRSICNRGFCAVGQKVSPPLGSGGERFVRTGHVPSLRRIERGSFPGLEMRNYVGGEKDHRREVRDVVTKIVKRRSELAIGEWEK